MIRKWRIVYLMGKKAGAREATRELVDRWLRQPPTCLHEDEDGCISNAPSFGPTESSPFQLQLFQEELEQRPGF